jgi:hypothetical protein
MAKPHADASVPLETLAREICAQWEKLDNHRISFG